MPCGRRDLEEEGSERARQGVDSARQPDRQDRGDRGRRDDRRSHSGRRQSISDTDGAMGRGRLAFTVADCVRELSEGEPRIEVLSASNPSMVRAVHEGNGNEPSKRKGEPPPDRVRIVPSTLNRARTSSLESAFEQFSLGREAGPRSDDDRRTSAWKSEQSTWSGPLFRR